MCRALAAAQKQPQRGKRAGEVRKVLNLSSKKRQELLTNHPSTSPGTPWRQVTATGYKPPSAQEKLEQVLDWFFFKRNRTPRWLASEKEKEGDLRAHEQLVRAQDEFWRLLNGHGPVTSLPMSMSACRSFSRFFLASDSPLISATISISFAAFGSFAAHSHSSNHSCFCFPTMPSPAVAGWRFRGGATETDS
jgi:hypothetical protein